MKRVQRSQEQIQQDIKEGSKECSVCRVRQPLEEYFKDSGNADGHMARCKLCSAKVAKGRRQKRTKKKNTILDREYMLKYKYGISLEEYDDMLTKQDGKCAICGSRDSKSKVTQHFFVDHCHTTGKVRGLLCNKCNIGLGQLEDDINILQSAIEYITESRPSVLMG